MQDARRVAETSTPGARGMLVYQVVRGEIFRGASVPDEYSELARMGDAALQYPATTAGITTRPAVTPQSADA